MSYTKEIDGVYYGYVATVIASRSKIATYHFNQGVYNAVGFGMSDTDIERLADCVTEAYNSEPDEDDEHEEQERLDAVEWFFDHEDDDFIDGVGFADPGGRSSLRAATDDNPRDQPCPSCGAKDVLTRIDVQRGYQCDRCADRAEGRGGYGDY